MHIAVCDDNIADRKQTERLLGRASEALKKEGFEGLFIDSFGNPDALLHNPQMYDGFFIDMKEDGANGLELARSLLKCGCGGQIILLKSTIDYYNIATSKEQELFHFMDKPIKTSELRSMLDMCEAFRKKKEPLIELRDDNETVYAKGSQIVFARTLETGRIGIKLDDGRELKVLTDLRNFYELLDDYYFLLPVSEYVIVNIRMIDKIGLTNVTMTDGTKFHMAMHFNKYIRGQVESERKHPGIDPDKLNK